MGQKRGISGVNFERTICESNNWTHKSTSPKIKWCGDGKIIWDKIKSIDCDPQKLELDIERCDFNKHDAINNQGEKIEIKKYHSEILNKWTLYSEPIFKVANHTTMKKVINLFGGDYEKSIYMYNNFLDGVKEDVKEVILSKITNSNIGIQLSDCFIDKDDLEFQWFMIKGWYGYSRLSIMTRKKQ